jgi:hypothetical protein
MRAIDPFDPMIDRAEVMRAYTGIAEREDGADAREHRPR